MEGAVMLTDSALVADALSRDTESVPTAVSPVVMVESMDW